MELDAKKATNASTVIDVFGMRTSKKIKKDAMSVDCKRRKLEEIEDQVTDQFTVKLLEEENITVILKTNSKQGFM